MGKGSPVAEPERVRCAARRIKTRTLSSPSLLPPTSSVSAATNNNNASTATPPATSRRYTTLTRPEIQNGRVVEYSDSPRSTVITTTTTTARSSKDVDVQSRPKPWVVNTPTTGTPTSTRNQRLEQLNLRGPRRASRTLPNTAMASSSCKRSDSTANDSQRSVLTSESLEAVPATCVHKGEEETADEQETELTEEELERRRNIEKCMSWINKLPAKFSGMHIVQERAPVTHD